MNAEEYRIFFQSFPFWEHMSEKEQELVLSHVRQAHYPAGSAVQSAEQHCLGTVFLLKGILRVYLLSAQGKEATPIPAPGGRRMYPVRLLYALCCHL